MQNNYACYEDGKYRAAICVPRGWSIPGGANFTAHDETVYRRELIRLELSLGQAKRRL